MKMLCPLHLFFSWGLSGAAQRQTGGSFIRKKLYPLHQFKVIESVRMSAKRAKRKKEMGKEINLGQARLGKKMDQLVVYTIYIPDPAC